MIFNPFTPGFYAPTNQLLLGLARRDVEQMRDRWQDEAAEAALAGNPQRAGYLEHLSARVIA